MTTVTRPAAPPATTAFSAIDVFAAATAERQMGTQLRLIREAAVAFRAWFPSTGTPDYVATFPLVSVPYPTKFGLFRAHLSPAPFVSITNRLMVIQWRDPDGRARTMLFEPSDVELGRNTPFFAQLTAKTPKQFEQFFVKPHGDVLGHLRSVGIKAAEVDYITFDHLHTQDVRRWIGTTDPQPDISPNRPLEAIFPNARLIVQRSELESLKELHPLQQAWYQPETYRHLRPEAILAIDGDVQLGPGLALLATPGHSIGNHTLVLNTNSGIWASSENVIATECLTPEISRIPGVARYARTWPHELVLNANTIESTAQQYNSCIKEKSIVDRSARDPRFLQFFPSSELTASRLNPGTSPTFVHGGIAHGAPLRLPT